MFRYHIIRINIMLDFGYYSTIQSFSTANMYCYDKLDYVPYTCSTVTTIQTACATFPYQLSRDIAHPRFPFFSRFSRREDVYILFSQHFTYPKLLNKTQILSCTHPLVRQTFRCLWFAILSWSWFGAVCRLSCCSKLALVTCWKRDPGPGTWCEEEEISFTFDYRQYPQHPARKGRKSIYTYIYIFKRKGNRKTVKRASKGSASRVCEAHKYFANQKQNSPVKCEFRKGDETLKKEMDHLFCLFIFRNLVVPNQIVNTHRIQ